MTTFPEKLWGYYYLLSPSRIELWFIALFLTTWSWSIGIIITIIFSHFLIKWYIYKLLNAQSLSRTFFSRKQILTSTSLTTALAQTRTSVDTFFMLMESLLQWHCGFCRNLTLCWFEYSFMINYWLNSTTFDFFSYVQLIWENVEYD